MLRLMIIIDCEEVYFMRNIYKNEINTDKHCFKDYFKATPIEKVMIYTEMS